MVDLIAGQIALMFSNQLGVLPHINSGKMKALGVASAERSPVLPDVPTFPESGFPDLKVSVWWGVMGPAAMPKEIVTQLNREIVAALASPEMKDRLQSMSARPLGGTPEQFTAFFNEETTRWARVVKASGAKVD
jgi:tripartite-type tricarboxylate transporter receptor subunit TctC